MKVTLKALRVNAEMTQDEAAYKLNISTKTLQNWENNVTFPTAQQLMKVCSIYGCGIGDIFFPESLAKS